MTTPVMLLGTALLFWGWQTGYLIHGVAMAAVLEGSRLVRLRWDFSLKDFSRITDLCTLLVLGFVVYQFAAETQFMGRWIPMAIFPLLAAQAYSTKQQIDLGALFYLIRRKEKRKTITPQKRRMVDISYHAFALIVIGASAANNRTPVFYIAMVVLVFWALWPLRSKRYGITAWALLLATTALMGWCGQIGLHYLQLRIEDKIIQWLVRDDLYDDSLRTDTAIGDIGKVKLHDQIIMRVTPEGSFSPSPHYRQACYNIYRDGSWYARWAKFSPVAQVDPAGTWHVADTRGGGGRAVWISARLRKGKGLLALPDGVEFIDALPVLKMERNQYGALRVSGGPDFVHFRVAYQDEPAGSSPHTKADLDISPADRAVIDGVADQLGLKRLPREEVSAAIHDYFQTFRYSLIQDLAEEETPPLENFLLRTKAGHCEFFATATVLLLRAAGIPARYATGYVVSEYSLLEKRFIVRARHAHAWALAHVDNTWQIADNTPSVWMDIEQKQTSVFQPLLDMGNWFNYLFGRWRSKQRTEAFGWVIWVSVALAGVLAWRVIRRKRTKTIKERKSIRKSETAHRGQESSFSRIEVHLRDRFGFERYPWEPHSQWIDRMAAAGVSPTALDSLKVLLVMHYRQCFHPSGLNTEESAKMATGVTEWIETFSSKNLFIGSVGKKARDID